MSRAAVLLCLVSLIYTVTADLYLQFPPGSNGRLREANTNRNNANRLMDTQNNAKGGYCQGPAMSFYEGSLLSIEWTNQHGCGDPKLECNIVIQYMCGLGKEEDPAIQIRDGETTDTIPDNVNNFNQLNAETGTYQFGMHESYAYYQGCKTRFRNKGLFVADRVSRGNLNGERAINTRQNNNGNRHGFECPEERDYYPYWHPSPWKDIVVLTDDTKLCKFFKKESQNVAKKGYCEPGATATSTDPQPSEFNTERLCTENGKKWLEADSHNIKAPDCLETPFNRDNHLGNTNGYANTYNWTIPKSEACVDHESGCNCVLRIRYNISTADIDGWGFVDSQLSGANSPVKQDPNVAVEGFNLSLAIDTTQFGRTFEDRSHVFHIVSRPKGISGNARIFNLNVKGKRGNIVQTYPSTEYDFHPNILHTRVGDYVHFQWTGCDQNPAGNAGEGTDQTDRSNIVQVSDLGASYPASEEWIDKHNALFESSELRTSMAFLDQDVKNCPTYEELLKKNNDNNNQVEQDVTNCFKLNAASQHFNAGLIKMNTTDTYYFMSTRNNNFSNRGQKGTLTVDPLLPTWAIALVSVGGALFLGSAGVGAAMFYAKSHPHSSIANLFSKI